LHDLAGRQAWLATNVQGPGGALDSLGDLLDTRITLLRLKAKHNPEGQIHMIMPFPAVDRLVTGASAADWRARSCPTSFISSELGILEIYQETSNKFPFASCAENQPALQALMSLAIRPIPTKGIAN
jgi:hypothetical protein